MKQYKSPDDKLIHVGLIGIDQESQTMRKIELVFGIISDFGWYILFPSLLIIIVLMGMIDNSSSFIPSAKGNLTMSGAALSGAFVNMSVAIVNPLYKLGTHNYSGLIIIILISCCIGLFTMSVYNRLRTGHENR